MTKHHRKILFSAIGIITIIAIVLLYFGFIESKKTPSPNGQYSVSYNVLTNTITTRYNGETGYLIFGENPDFLWAPDSERLAITATNEYGKRWSNVIYFKNHQGIVMPSKSQILAASNEAEEESDDNDATIIIDDWLDNTHVLMKFSWLDDTGAEVAGWFSFDLLTREIEGLQFSNE